MPMALLPEVVILPKALIVMAPSVVPNVPMLPALMPAAKVPLVAMSPVEVMVMGP